jgi:hypothetical protein
MSAYGWQRDKIKQRTKGYPMFDNLREEANSSPYFQESAQFQPAAGTTSDPAVSKPRKLFGMTPVQRFIIAVMLAIVVCNLGLMCLLVTGRMGI